MLLLLRVGPGENELDTPGLFHLQLRAPLQSPQIRYPKGQASTLCLMLAPKQELPKQE